VPVDAFSFAFAAKAQRVQVHANRLCNLSLPSFADFREIVGPAVSAFRCPRAMTTTMSSAKLDTLYLALGEWSGITSTW